MNALAAHWSDFGGEGCSDASPLAETAVERPLRALVPECSDTFRVVDSTGRRVGTAFATARGLELEISREVRGAIVVQR